MNDAKILFEELAAALTAAPYVTRKPMFGLPSLFVNGKVFASLDRDEMIFKLPAEPLGQALNLPGAHLFDPMGNGRLMKEWVCVPQAHSARWEELAQTALAYIASLAGK